MSEQVHDRDPESPLTSPAMSPTMGPTVGPRPTAFQMAKAANTAPKTPEGFSGAVPGGVTDLLVAQEQARYSKDEKKKSLQIKREAFERKVALKMQSHPKVQQEVDKMLQKAVSFVEKMSKDFEEQKASLIAMGHDKYGQGGVPDMETVKKMLKGGSIREKMVMIGNFSETFGKKMIEMGGDKEKLKEKMNEADKAKEENKDDPSKKLFSADELLGPVKEGETRAKFGDSDIDAYAERSKKYLASMKPDDKGKMPEPDVKKMLAPIGMVEKQQKHASYSKAKSEDHDTKLPVLPVAQTKEAVKAGLTPEQKKAAPVLSTEMPKTAVRAESKDSDDPQDMTAAGQHNSVSQSTKKVEENPDFKLSETEDELAKKLAAERGVDEKDRTLPWMEGQKANIIDETKPFIKDAQEAAMPLKSGISGTTMRFMQTAELLGADPESSRMACVAMLQPIEAHSFHEIATAADGFAGDGKKYDPKSPYTEGSMSPLTTADLEAIALECGTTLAELNDPVMNKPEDKPSSTPGTGGVSANTEPPPPEVGMTAGGPPPEEPKTT
jgi:hypothetical protein